ncbi:MAG: 30S ribosome-binding factor RbfA [Dehalococcoidia bacterium]|nr:30S ribosome-binding factor RbfA [Dehalococcoidia bacterium]
MSRRTERLNDLIQEEISELLRRQIKDPRLSCFLTVTRVDTSPDLRFAKVFISIMGSDEEKNKAMDGLASASGFLYRELRGRLSLHRTPRLVFYKDDSIERGAQVLHLMKEVTSSEETDVEH